MFVRERERAVLTFGEMREGVLVIGFVRGLALTCAEVWHCIRGSRGNGFSRVICRFQLTSS